MTKLLTRICAALGAAFLLFSPLSVMAQTTPPPAAADPALEARKLAWLEKVQVVMPRMQAQAQRLQEAAQTQDNVKICAAIRPFFDDLLILRALMGEYVEIDPEGARAADYPAQLAKMDGQIAQITEQLKTTCPAP